MISSSIPPAGRRGLRRRLCRVLAASGLAAAFGLTGTSPASAATGVSVAGGVLRVQASEGVANDITVTGLLVGNQWRYRVTDFGDPLTAGAGCVQENVVTVVCGTFAGAGTISSAAVAPGDLNDRVILELALPVTVDAGAGNDRVVGGAGRDTVEGGDGNDTLYGGAGNDTITGDSGVDALDGGAGNDNLNDGWGAGVTMYGGSGNDVMQGSGPLYGESGNDTLYAEFQHEPRDLFGGDGNDTLWAAEGNRLWGGPGDDTLLGDTYEDRLYGGPGNDTLVADIYFKTFGSERDSADVLEGGEGNDTLDGRTGTGPNITSEDQLRGGSAVDTCMAEPTDVLEGCEMSGPVLGRAGRT